jgi:hypothetical protein
MRTIYLLPWEENNYPDAGCTGYVRKAFGIKYNKPEFCECRVWQYEFTNKWTHTYDPDTKFESKEEAMQAADTILSKFHYLISADQVERFEEKLRLLL